MDYIGRLKKDVDVADTYRRLAEQDGKVGKNYIAWGNTGMLHY